MLGTETEQQKFEDMLNAQDGKCAECGAVHKSQSGQKKILLSMNRFYSSFKLYCQSCAFALVKVKQGEPQYQREKRPDKKAEMLAGFGLKQESLL